MGPADETLVQEEAHPLAGGGDFAGGMRVSELP